MSKRVVIVIEYEANPYSEQWFKDVVTNLRKQVDTPDQAPIKPVHLWIGTEDHADRVLALLAAFADDRPAS